jgi:hypothetical protein
MNLRTTVRAWWLEQDTPIGRLTATRIVTGAATLRATWHLPPADIFTHEAKILDATADCKPFRLSAEQYQALRLISLTSVAAWTLGCDHIAVRVAANASTLLVHRQNATLHPPSWNYSTHLNAYLAFLTGLRRSDWRDPKTASHVLALMQAGYSWIYLQAGLSKLRNAGPAWINGSTLRGSWAECGTPLGRRLSRLDPKIAALATTSALAFELGFLLAVILANHNRYLSGMASLSFHALTKLTLDISFWHHYWLAIPLFLLPPTVAAALEESRCLPLTGPSFRRPDSPDEQPPATDTTKRTGPGRGLQGVMSGCCAGGPTRRGCPGRSARFRGGR